MNALAKIYFEEAKRDAIEYRKKAASATLEEAKTHFLEMASLREHHAWKWECLSFNSEIEEQA